MSFASEKLQKGYLRRKMPTIVSKVKVREIIAHLPCLTDHDRETIEAKRETNGNFDGMMLLLDCLKRRDNWPEQLIEALEACEQQTIAAEIRAEYDALRGINNSNASSPSVVHVHPPPSASHLPTPESSGKSQATVTTAPSEPVAQTTPTIPPPQTPVQPSQVQAIQSPTAPVPKAVSPHEPVSELPQTTQIEVAPLPSTPPPSPETQHTPASTPPPPPPQREVNAHQEPEENSESDIQDIAGDLGVIPDQVSTAQVNSVVTPSASRPVEQSETDTLFCPESLQTTTIVEARPPQSPSPVPTNSDVTDRSSVPILTPEKPPVQDTTPPIEKLPAVVLEPVETSERQTTQVVERRRQTEMAATAAPLPDVAVVDSSLVDVDSVCLSKPAQLISIQSQNHGHNTQVTTLEPYSGNSSRLEISDVAPDTVTSARVSTCSDMSSATGNTVSGGPCQENGNALNHSEPEENQYESPCESLEMQEVRMNVGHVSEEPSILNLDGQTSTPRAQIINSEAAKKITSASPLSTTIPHTFSNLNTQSSENYQPSEPAAADISSQLPDPEENGASHFLTDNTKYILGAAGVAALALLIVWKFKN